MLRYIAPVYDISGYAEAARNYICALLAVSVDLTVEVVSFEAGRTKDIDSTLQQIISPYVSKSQEFSINLMHMTPENYQRFICKDAYNIALVTWETDKLPAKWVELINLADEVWVPSSWNVEVFKNSRITKPIYCFPHTIDSKTISSFSDKQIFDVDDDTFVFYSIFQWIERKNPVGLILAYLTEFTSADNVCLLLKTYRDPQAVFEDDLAEIKAKIVGLRDTLHLGERGPRIRLVSGRLNRTEVLALHQRGDSFVLPSRSEGFSLTHFEAMWLGKPCIGTGYGGNLEFMNENNSILVKYNMCPVFGMPWNHYTGDQNWSTPHIDDLKKSMRRIYEGEVLRECLGTHAARDIREKFNWELIGGKMKQRLQEITKCWMT